jgi:hypothetical protein
MAKIEEYYEQFIVDYPFDDGTKKKEVVKSVVKSVVKPVAKPVVKPVAKPVVKTSTTEDSIELKPIPDTVTRRKKIQK